MKALGLIGTIFGVLALILGLYLFFVVAENAEIAAASDRMGPEMLGESYYGSRMHMINRSAIEFKTDFGIIVMGAGLIAFLFSIVPAIRKRKMAWIGVGTALIAFFVGAAYGTHMFS